MQCSNGLNGTALEDKCKTYNNKCKLKCSAFTESEKCRSDDCFWLYNESEGEEGNCKEKDDNNLRCDDAKRSNQCPLSDVNNLKEKKCIWVLNRCYDVKSTCESITVGGDICEANGAAVTSNGDTLKCSWLEENTTKNITGRCTNEVYLRNIFFFNEFIYINLF
jgi:hypothetical protein